MPKSKIVSIGKIEDKSSEKGKSWLVNSVVLEDGQRGNFYANKQEYVALLKEGYELEYELNDKGYIKPIFPKPAFGGGMAANTSQAKAAIAVAAYQIAKDDLNNGRITREEFMEKLNGHAAVITKLYKSINL